MNFKIVHNNYNVLDLEKSMAFYEKALGLTEKSESLQKTEALFWSMWEMNRLPI